MESVQPNQLRWKRDTSLYLLKRPLKNHLPVSPWSLELFTATVALINVLQKLTMIRGVLHGYPL